MVSCAWLDRTVNSRDRRMKSDVVVCFIVVCSKASRSPLPHHAGCGREV